MNVINGFRKRINELFDKSGKSAAKLARELDTLPQVISKWRNRLIDPKLGSLLKLADCFECSLEYLCDKTDVRLSYKPETPPPFSLCLETALHDCGCSSYRLIKDTPISAAQYHNWRHGIQPLLTSLQTVAAYLSITLDRLVGRDRSLKNMQ